MKINKIVYWIAIGLLSLLMLASAGMYFFQHEDAVTMWESLGFPSYPIYFLGVCKVLGVITILSNYNATLKEWAYAGFFFNFSLALLAQINAGDQPMIPAVAMILLLTSYFFGKKIN